MKLISWNVNGLRACVNKGFFRFLEEHAPDVLCLQETKMERAQADFQFPGYHEYWNSAIVKKGYSGTALFSRREPLCVSYGMGLEEHDGEGRVITAEFDELILVTVYTPNAKRGLERLPYRMVWEDAFREYVGRLREKKPVIICGDLNVAHQPIDLKNPKPNEGNAGYTKEEREKLTALLENGFIDAFRHFYPEQAGAYSWWSYMYHARQNNAGWRIDYFLADKRLENSLEDSRILSDVLGSDHCPVELILK